MDIAHKNKYVMTEAEQNSISPEHVLKELLANNNRFNRGNVTHRFHNQEIRETVRCGQFPKAMVLSCLYNRIQNEDVFV